MRSMTDALKNGQLRLPNSKVDQMNSKNQNGLQLESCNPLILNRILAERTGDSAKTAQTQCSCGFQADAHSKATLKE